MRTEYTEKEYARFLGYIKAKNLDYENISDIVEYINNIKNIKKSNNESLCITTIKLYIVATHWYLKKNNGNQDHIRVLNLEIENLSKEINKKVQTHELIGTQKQNYLDWSKILEMYEGLKKDYKKTKNKHKMFAILSCYILVCPRRLKDYAQMFVVDNETDHNDNKNYYIKTGQFVFNNYKTSKNYKSQSIRVPNELNLILSEYVNTHNITSSLFGLTESALQFKLARIFTKHTGKRVSVNILRHSFISWAKDNNKIIGNENNIALMMGHSVSMQNDYYKDPEKSGEESSDDDLLKMPDIY
jgi:integrase